MRPQAAESPTAIANRKPLEELYPDELPEDLKKIDYDRYMLWKEWKQKKVNMDRFITQELPKPTAEQSIQENDRLMQSLHQVEFLIPTPKRYRAQNVNFQSI